MLFDLIKQMCATHVFAMRASQDLANIGVSAKTQKLATAALGIETIILRITYVSTIYY